MTQLIKNPIDILREINRLLSQSQTIMAEETFDIKQDYITLVGLINKAQAELKHMPKDLRHGNYYLLHDYLGEAWECLMLFRSNNNKIYQLEETKQILTNAEQLTAKMEVNITAPAIKPDLLTNRLAKKQKTVNTDRFLGIAIGTSALISVLSGLVITGIFIASLLIPLTPVIMGVAAGAFAVMSVAAAVSLVFCLVRGCSSSRPKSCINDKQDAVQQPLLTKTSEESVDVEQVIKATAYHKPLKGAEGDKAKTISPVIEERKAALKGA